MIAALFLTIDLLNFSHPETPCSLKPPVTFDGGEYQERPQTASVDSVKQGSLRAGTQQALVVMSCTLEDGATKAVAYLYDLRDDSAKLLGRVAGTIWGIDSDSIHAGFANRLLYVDTCKDSECTVREFRTYSLRGDRLVKTVVAKHPASSAVPIPSSVDFLNFTYPKPPCPEPGVIPQVRVSHRNGGTWPLSVFVSSVKFGSLGSGTRQAVVELSCTFLNEPGGGSVIRVFDTSGDAVVPLGQVGESSWGGDGGCDGINSRFRNDFLFVNSCVNGMDTNIGVATTYALRAGKLLKSDERTAIRIGFIKANLGFWTDDPHSQSAPDTESYSWDVHEIVSIGGVVARETDYAVTGEPIGPQTRTLRTAPLVKRSFTLENQKYIRELAALAQLYVHFDSYKLQLLYDDDQVALGPVTPDVVTMAVHNFARRGDTITVAFDRRLVRPRRIDVSTYERGPSDPVKIEADFREEECGPVYITKLTVEDLRRSLNVQQMNSNLVRSCRT